MTGIRRKFSLKCAAWIVAGILIFVGMGLWSDSGVKSGKNLQGLEREMNSQGEGTGLKVSTFGEGCFWCMEAIFQRLQGVEKVVSGYSGGRVASPTYEQVCAGTRGTPSYQITYDPARISYDELLEVFWKTHDPTTLNRQGNDVGTQYRCAIFCHDDEQRQLAEGYKAKLAFEISGTGR